jgi:hypothetical protein
MALSQKRTPEPVAPDAAKFVSSLAIAWRTGEVRPTHRQEPKPGRSWRTRKDPFAEVWPVLLGWLDERPDFEAKEMLQRLQASGFGQYPDGQLRTLQRRVRLWPDANRSGTGLRRRSERGTQGGPAGGVIKHLRWLEPSVAPFATLSALLTAQPPQSSF